MKRKKNLEMDAFYYKGDRYKDLKECCKQYGINVQSVHSYRFRNKDSDYDEAIDYIRTDEMTHALCLAAKRGVDVRIITPGIPDKKFIYNITRSFYHGLVKHGV
ncbi:MAG: hypothetical protein ACLVB7_02295, partial [Coprococcus comes]